MMIELNEFNAAYLQEMSMEKLSNHNECFPINILKLRLRTQSNIRIGTWVQWVGCTVANNERTAFAGLEIHVYDYRKFGMLWPSRSLVLGAL
jgi:hypothetical protein